MRRAFVIGSNGPDDPMLSKIRYAPSDAARMTEHLSGFRCGFEVIRPSPGASIYDILAELSNVARSCSAEDTFVCYFAGHGLVEGAELFLLWDDSDVRGLFGTALPVSQVMLAMRFCKAGSKLLFLDCCHAGAAVIGGGLRSGMNERAEDVGVKPENHMVLMASDRLERAREIEELGGGFLTAQVCRALGECFKEADADSDAKLSLDELKAWLDRMASEHNRRYPDRRVPVPYLFGQRRGPFFLTLDAPEWVPYEIPWPDGSVMVVLPVRPVNGQAYCIGKHPVTNSQYRSFVESNVWAKEPSGERWVKEEGGAEGGNNPQRREPPNLDETHVEMQGRWQGPFWPWRDAAFSRPDQPVVCTSYMDSAAYCDWVNNSLKPPGRTSLAHEHLWDFAAFGVQYTPRNKQVWLGQTAEIHQKSFAPAPIDLTGKRMNRRGVADMIGNVWEWCDAKEVRPVLGLGMWPELRGGGFLDDLSLVAPYLSGSALPEQENTRHSDLGFRVSAIIPIGFLPDEIVHRLELRGEEVELPLFYVPPTA